MHTVIAFYLTAVARLQSVGEEDGQTSVEWLGIAFVIGAIVLAVANLAPDLGGTVGEAFQAMVERATGG